MKKLGYLDVLVIALVLIVVAGIYWRVDSGLNYNWNWHDIVVFLVTYESGHWRFGPLLQGLAVTVKLAVYSIIIGLLLGAIAALSRQSQLLLLRLFALCYVQLIRNLPPLVLVLFCYYFFADQLFSLLGLDQALRSIGPTGARLLQLIFSQRSVLGAFIAAVLILGLYQGAYIAEIFRGGLLAIPTTQYQAASSLALSQAQTIWFVIIPQVWHRTLPALAGQLISAIKDSSIVSLISIAELTFQGNQVAISTGAFFESAIMVFLLYLVVTLSCSAILARIFPRQQHLR